MACAKLFYYTDVIYFLILFFFSRPLFLSLSVQVKLTFCLVSARSFRYEDGDGVVRVDEVGIRFLPAIPELSRVVVIQFYTFVLYRQHPLVLLQQLSILYIQLNIKRYIDILDYRQFQKEDDRISTKFCVILFCIRILPLPNRLTNKRNFVLLFVSQFQNTFVLQQCHFVL